MSEFDIEEIKARANGMSEEQMRVFLTEVDEGLLAEEVHKRMAKLKRIEKQGRELFSEE